MSPADPDHHTVQIVSRTDGKPITPAALKRLTKRVLRLKYSPPQARRLWELHKMGVSLGTLARADKVLRSFGVTPKTDYEWAFFLGSCAHATSQTWPLEMYHEESGTRIEAEEF